MSELLTENGRPERAVLDKIPPVALAYVGDTIFDLYLRTGLVLGPAMSPHEMHERASHFARASAQAKMAQRLLPELTEEETALLKRARNQRSISVPKHASPVDYKWATGLEAMLGYLYLDGQQARIKELLRKGMAALTAEPAAKEEKESMP